MMVTHPDVHLAVAIGGHTEPPNTWTGYSFCAQWGVTGEGEAAHSWGKPPSPQQILPVPPLA